MSIRSSMSAWPILAMLAAITSVGHITPARVSTRSGFFLYMSLACLAVALIGFSTTFFLPLIRGTSAESPLTYVHGTILFGWMLFLIAQASLIRVRSVSVHRRLGWLGAALGVAVVLSGVAVSFNKALGAPGEDDVLSEFVGNLVSFVIYGSLVAAALVLRRDTASHKRLLLLATIFILGPAWTRFSYLFPSVDNTVFFLAMYFPLLVAIAHDVLTHKRVHPIYVWVGCLFVAWDTTILLASQSAAWLRVARWLLGEAAV